MEFRNQRHNLFNIHGNIRQRRGDDDLIIRIDDGFRVKGVVELPVSCLHNPCIRVGEVALRFRGDDRVRRRRITVLDDVSVLIARLSGFLLRLFTRPSRRVRLQPGARTFVPSKAT